jgi:hypothetical protein
MSSIKAVLFAQQEDESGLELECALESARNRHLVSEDDIQSLECYNAKCLYALNPQSRIIWGHAFIQHFADYHGLCQDNLIPNQKLTWVTLADISCVTTDKPQELDFDKFKRRYRPALKGLNFIGMIEPGYYVNIAQGSRFAGTRMVSWHLHAIAWGEDPREIQRRFLALNHSGKYRAIYEGVVALHAVRLAPNQIPIKLRYILKAPRKAYTIGKHTKTVDGKGHFKFIQNKRNLRPGERIKLLLLMNDLYLNQLAMAGGEGADLLRRIKYEALRELREDRDI